MQGLNNQYDIRFEIVVSSNHNGRHFIISINKIRKIIYHIKDCSNRILMNNCRI